MLLLGEKPLELRFQACIEEVRSEFWALAGARTFGELIREELLSWLELRFWEAFILLLAWIVLDWLFVIENWPGGLLLDIEMLFDFE